MKNIVSLHDRTSYGVLFTSWHAEQWTILRICAWLLSIGGAADVVMLASRQYAFCLYESIREDLEVAIANVGGFLCSLSWLCSRCLALIPRDEQTFLLGDTVHVAFYY